MMNKAPEIQSSHAILLLNDDYILQLRDNKPDIAAPGEWSLFGGMVKSNETPLQTIQREIFEELSIQPDEFRHLWFEDYFSSFEKTVIRTWFFVSEVSTVWEGHNLMEGQDIGIFPYQQIQGLKMPLVMRKTIERFHEMANGLGLKV